MISQTPRKDPELASALLVFAALSCLATYLLIPREKLAQFGVLFPRMDTLVTLILAGIVYGTFSCLSWIHHNLTLRTPGKTISAMRRQKPNFKLHAVYLLFVLAVGLPITCLLTSLLPIQSKLLAHLLGWSAAQPWWIPAFVCLIPFSCGVGDLCWLFTSKLRKMRKKFPSLPPISENPSQELCVNIGSKGEDGRNPEWVTLGETDLLKSMIITGGVGFGKTQLIFRILDQVLASFRDNPKRKLSLLLSLWMTSNSSTTESLSSCNSCFASNLKILIYWQP
ncbi:MAG: hypothetical protein HYW48_02430 [Deltaproteobacteria bacterium]|nr:hypothetical protein [Deltaproteobacteria bacterium]